MLQNESESGEANSTENKNEIIKEATAGTMRSKDVSCRLCRLPKIGSNQVRPNGLRGCKCEELSPYYYSSPPSRNVDRQDLTDCPERLRYTQNPETNVAQNLESQKNETCSAEAELLRERSFVPPQGMDTGEYPRALFYQYYPNRNKVCTFDLLPLPFLEGLKYQEMRYLSLDNDDIQKKWKSFLYNLPNSELQSTALYPNDEFWRWKKYLRYTPDVNKTEFRYKMQTGPKYDAIGRLPITGEDLKMFRELKAKPKTNLKYILKKGDGTRKK